MMKRSKFKNEYDKKRYSLERLKGVYIPQNLEECFQELDKLISEDIKSRLKSLDRKQRLFGHSFGAGLWMRNNWGFWQGSRLQLYFHLKGISDPDEMSAIISFFYVDWLKGINENWKNWEEHPKSWICLI